MSTKISKKIRAFASDNIWVHENFDDLYKKYAEQWIAVKNHQVIASDVDFFTLKDKLQDSPRSCIEFITRDPLVIII